MKKLNLKCLVIVFVFFSFMFTSIAFCGCAEDWIEDLEDGMNLVEWWQVSWDMRDYIRHEMEEGSIDCARNWIRVAGEAIRLNNGGTCQDYMLYEVECADGVTPYLYGWNESFDSAMYRNIGEVCIWIASEIWPKK